jgi:hypothetical protein
VTGKIGEIYSARKVDFSILFSRTFRENHISNHIHYSSAIRKSEVDEINSLYATSNSILSRSELIIDKPW